MVNPLGSVIFNEECLDAQFVANYSWQISATLWIIIILFLGSMQQIWRYWRVRRFWFPMQERSTNCTLAFLICTGLNFLVFPVAILIMNYYKSIVTTNSITDMSIRFFYLWTRVSLASIYAGKVIRLTYACVIANNTNSMLYSFLRSERKVLISSLLLSMVIAAALVLQQYIQVFVIGYTDFMKNPQQFWLPFQSGEALVFSTLILLMKDVIPHYKISSEIIAMFLTNFILAFLANIGNVFNWDQCVYATVLFVCFQVRCIFDILFCVVLPLLYSTEKSIPLPNERLILQSLVSPESLLLLISLYGELVSEPFVQYLRHLDTLLALNLPQSTEIWQRLSNLSRQHPLILFQRNYEQLFQFYICISLAISQDEHSKVIEIANTYLFPQQDSSLFFSATIKETMISQKDLQSQQADNTNLLSSQQAISMNLLSIPFNQQQLINRTHLIYPSDSYWKKQNQQLNDLFLFSQHINNIIANAFQKDPSNESTDIQIQKQKQIEALQLVQDEIFIYIHILWNQFYSRTKSFQYIKDTFEHFGTSRNHLLNFNLTNEKFTND